MKKGVAGTMESSDAQITVTESNDCEIVIESIVYDFFKEQIRQVILTTLKEQGITQIKVEVKDKGALDYTIKARLLTAIRRMEENHA